MDKNLKTAFDNIKHKPDTNLADSIWQKIIIRNKRITLIKSSAFSLLGIISILGLFPVADALFSEFTKSGFYEYFSLLFSKNDGITYYWKELAFSLVESLPVINIIYTFMLILTLFISLKFVAKQVVKNRLSIRNSSLSY